MNQQLNQFFLIKMSTIRTQKRGRKNHDKGRNTHTRENHHQDR